MSGDKEQIRLEQDARLWRLVVRAHKRYGQTNIAAALEDSESARDQASDEVDSLSAEVERLKAEVARLKAGLHELASDGCMRQDADDCDCAACYARTLADGPKQPGPSQQPQCAFCDERNETVRPRKDPNDLGYPDVEEDLMCAGCAAQFEMDAAEPTALDVEWVEGEGIAPPGENASVNPALGKASSADSAGKEGAKGKDGDRALDPKCANCGLVEKGVCPGYSACPVPF